MNKPNGLKGFPFSPRLVLSLSKFLKSSYLPVNGQGN